MNEEQSLASKLIAVQSDLKAPKSQYNSFGKYLYRNCEDILEAVKPLLAKHGLLLNLRDEIVQIGERYYIRATAEVICGVEKISSWAYAREPKDKKGMDDSQITGCASSYARKYALNGLFLIDDTKDADSMDNTQQSQKKTTPAQKPIDIHAIANKETVNAMKRGITKEQLQEHCYRAFGKESLKELTDEEAKTYVEWVKNAKACKSMA